MSPCYKKIIFLLSFQMNKCGVSFFSGGDLGSQFYLLLPGSKLKRSFASCHRDGRVCLLWATNTLANFCNTTPVNVMISEATCILRFCISTPNDVYPYQTKKMMCYSLVRVTQWRSPCRVPSPIPCCPEERCWAPCPWKGRTRHTAVLVSSYFCRQKTQQLETVNSFSIIILHITQGWLA